MFVSRDHPYLSPPSPRAFAHRGWHIDDFAGLENSLAGFRRAADEGYVHIETDVQVAADGVVVVHHDDSLDRTTDRRGLIRALPWSEIRRARIGGKVPVSRLEDVLEELPGVHLNVDVKTDAAVEPFVRVIQRTGAFSRVAAASFSARRLGRIRNLAGPRMLMSMGPLSIAAARYVGRIPGVPVRSLVHGWMAQVPTHYHGRRLVDAQFVRAIHRLGAEVHVWTVDEPGQMNELLDLGVDGLITDRPDILRDVLRTRGAWPPPRPDSRRSPAATPPLPPP